MKNIYDVMRQKELEIDRLKKEIEALRLVAPMLEEKEPAIATSQTPVTKTYSSPQQSDSVITADAGKAARVWP
jgi:hypothetical protein